MATTKTDPKLTIANGKKSRAYEGLTREQLIEALSHHVHPGGLMIARSC